jgi:hypothetical protein
VVGAVAAVVIAGTALAVHAASDQGTPNASTVADGTTSSTPAALSTEPGTAPSGNPGTASGGAPGSVVVFSVSGPDLPGANVLDACKRDTRQAIARYDTVALGDVTMQCGNSSQGYDHIRIRHRADWTDELGRNGGRDWDDLMLTAVQGSLLRPGAGFPKDAGDGKVCYAAGLRFSDGTTPPEPFVKVIVSETTDRVITAYPTRNPDC